MAPRAKSEAAVSTIAGRSGSKCFITGIVVNAVIRCCCAASISGVLVQSFVLSAIEFVRGSTMLL